MMQRLKLFFALSRTPHGLLDMTAPVFAALVWLGEFPSLGVSLLGLLTVFAGYTTVYALNDIVDFKSDCRKVEKGVFRYSEGDLDAVLVRHPMAQGLIRYRDGVFWAAAWALVTLIGAYALNPVCLMIFLAAAGLETVYCLLWNVSPMRTLVSGAVKTSGSIAAVYAVDPSPSFLFVSVLFFFLFFWEIGGQNIANDWSDMELDAQFKAKTIPIKLGSDLSAYLILLSIAATLVLNVLVFITSKVEFDWTTLLLSFGAGAFLLLVPAVRLYRHQTGYNAMALFSKASYFPLFLLAIVMLKIIFRGS